MSVAHEVKSYKGRIAVIGGGVMGEAIVRGWFERRAAKPEAVSVVEPSESRRKALGALDGLRVVATAEEALPADLVLLAVKPQVIDGVVTELSSSLGGALVVSIAAGVSTARLESLLPQGTRVVRVMPNTPAMVGEGMAVISGGSEPTARDVDAVRELFEAIGKAVVIEERYQNAASAVSGSGPAYFALVIDALSRAGVAAGLTRSVAQVLAVQTMYGTARMIAETGVHPEALIDGVTSPGGTTIAALGRLEAGGVRAAFDEAVRAAVARAEELG
jgi:pyrroline-5-carboxylate reductase